MMNSRVVRGVMFVTLIGLLMVVPRSASAFSIVHTLVCDALKATPLYWDLSAAITGLKNANALSSEADCLELGDFVGDLSIPTGAYKDCICPEIQWPVAPPPLPQCSDPHNVCTQGSALGGSTLMMGCTETYSDLLAGLICDG